MQRTQLLAALKQMIEEDLGESVDEIDEAQSLREGLGLDSVDLFSLAIQVEERFHVELDSASLENVETVGDLLTLLETKLPSSSKAA